MPAALEGRARRGGRVAASSSATGSTRAAPGDRHTRRLDPVEWNEFVAAAKSTNWITYIGTADAHGKPHVAVVAPGFESGAVWFATNRTSKKYRNLEQNQRAAFHWPVGSGGAGEVAAWGSATLHPSPADRRRIWESGIFEYDLDSFFGSPDNERVAFVEVVVEEARLIGPGFEIDRYRPS